MLQILSAPSKFSRIPGSCDLNQVSQEVMLELLGHISLWGTQKFSIIPIWWRKSHLWVESLGCHWDPRVCLGVICIVTSQPLPLTLSSVGFNSPLLNPECCSDAKMGEKRAWMLSDLSKIPYTRIPFLTWLSLIVKCRLELRKEQESSVVLLKPKPMQVTFIKYNWVLNDSGTQ